MNKKSPAWMCALAALFFLFALGESACKEDVPISNLTVSNECGLAVNVYMNGAFQFYLEYGFMKTIKNLDWGTYKLEARRSATDQIVASEDVYVRLNDEVIWHVWSSAGIRITNNYGIELSIYGDNVHVGDLDDQQTSLMEHVPYGERKLEARLSDGTVVKSTTVSVTEDINYTWVIEK